ncbi:MAG: hypothetical protein ABJC36_10435, partial [Gemmatimonadales bacterium]
MSEYRPTGPRHVIGGYREFAPLPVLAVAAESVWVHRSTAAGMHLVLPDPALNLAFRCRRLPGGGVRGAATHGHRAQDPAVPVPLQRRRRN